MDRAHLRMQCRVSAQLSAASWPDLIRPPNRAAERLDPRVDPRINPRVKPRDGDADDGKVGACWTARVPASAPEPRHAPLSPAAPRSRRDVGNNIVKAELTQRIRYCHLCNL